jgi:MFS family permease
MSATPTGSSAERPSARRLLSPPFLAASVAIYTTVALVAFEGTAVAAALPQLAGDLGRVDLLPWTITAFLFASGLATVLAGPLVDALGTRVIFRWSAAVFAGAGFTAGLAQTMTVLITIRMIQGAGSGMLIAATLAAVNLVYPDALVGRAFAANSTIWGVMGAAAPAIAAFMLTALSWRWIFFLNLPLGLISLVAGWRAMPARQEGAESTSIDWLGAGLIAAFTLTSLLAVDEIGIRSLLWAGVAVVAAVVYRFHARRRDKPVVRLEHVIGRPYLGLASVIGLLLVGAFATNIYITLYVSAGRGAGPGLTAWSVLFFTLGWSTGANVASRLMDRMSETTVMLLGVTSTVTGLALSAVAVGLTWPLPGLFSGLSLAGLGIGLSTNAALSLLRVATPSNQIGRATAAHQFMRNQGFTLGSALGGAVLLLVVSNSLGSVEPVQELLAGGGEGAGGAGSGSAADVSASVAEAVQSGYGTTVIVSLVIAALAFVPMRHLRRIYADARRARWAVAEQT